MPEPTPTTGPASRARVVVIGAGASGLTAARDLAATGHEVTVVDKGRAVGGRLASRRIGEADFDHGAQFVTTKHDDVRDVFDGWRRAGVLVPWFTGSPDAPARSDTARDGHPRFRGSPRMRSLAEHLAAPLPDVRTGLRVTEVRADPGGWLVSAVPVDRSDPVRLTATAVLCTAPVPQTLALLDAGGVELTEHAETALRPVTYDPTIALLAIPTGPTSLPNEGALRLADGPVSWLGDGLRKGTSSTPAVVVHASPDVSRDLWGASDEEIADHVLTAARPHLGVDASAVYVHRWRYATPTGPPPGGDDLALLDHAPAPIAFAGDAFAGGRVEGAVRSGRAAAHLLTSALAP
ncbi:NAD(P)/FAD-dependent oxidoreductase [Nitriliruptor alkaliphilus]|uniref:NAD(P)/FAD-dependent oxidoreductase n=1 Tax=Nitriliruptor alkaliphilus TaxID=427918 RepID=UPI000695D42E|nr:FAD-dependent oxidoreductase [Nitriliruptor alkaliphilus]